MGAPGMGWGVGEGLPTADAGFVGVGDLLCFVGFEGDLPGDCALGVHAGEAGGELPDLGFGVGGLDLAGELPDDFEGDGVGAGAWPG